MKIGILYLILMGILFGIKRRELMTHCSKNIVIESVVVEEEKKGCHRLYGNIGIIVCK